jgi:hypothetical protein
MSRGNFQLRMGLTQRQFRVASVSVVAILLLLSAGVYVLRLFTDLGRQDRIAQFFDVGVEASLPTVFSTVNLLLGAVLAFLVHRSAVRYRRYWATLSLLLVYLAADESCQLHERVLPAMFPTVPGMDGERLPMPWIPFALAAVVLIGGAFIPFLLGIPRRTAVFLVIGGAVYIIGAVFFEWLGCCMKAQGIERGDVLYSVRRLVEEGLEMYGVVIVNVTLFRELVGRSFVFEPESDHA